MNNDPAKAVEDLYLRHFGKTPDSILALPASGSDRKYFRVFSEDKTVLGAWSPDPEENRAFLYLGRHFHSLGIRVPEIFAEDVNSNVYLLQDLEDTTLLTFAANAKKNSEEVSALYKDALHQLLKLQNEGNQNLDVSRLPGHKFFDRQARAWDLYYFKYCFLKLSGIHFDEDKLEADFNTLLDFLEPADSGYFMHRDFQGRNLMVFENKTWIIDFQGGKKGPLQYDVASLLYQGKADLSDSRRRQYLQFYLDELDQFLPGASENFLKTYFGFVLLRILQTLGAYGFRGYFERKQHFLESIPLALKNASELLAQEKIPALPEISKLIRQLAENKMKTSEVPVNEFPGLTITIRSFSYKKGIPADDSGHGEGFVFDCRGLENPGRYEEWKFKTGLETGVVNFLETHADFSNFIREVSLPVERTIKNFLSRDFRHLSVNFGCTGGQHRSVASAEALAVHIRKNFPVNVVVIHTARENWNLGKTQNNQG